jgi:hypothetical protein
VVNGVEGQLVVGLVGEVGFGDEHNVDVIIREEGAELVGVVEEAIGIPKSEAKGVGH